MGFDPFARGLHPVGVRTLSYRDEPTGRTLPFELWYPASAVHAGQDLAENTRDRFTIIPGTPPRVQLAVRDAAPAAGTHPVFLYFHGGYGDRRECTHLCTHLASHGYVVAAQSFAGDSILDTLPGPDGKAAVVTKTPIDESAKKRPQQASSFLDRLLATELPAGLGLDGGAVGTGGFSMGGFTALAINSIDRRIRAVFAMCPMFGEHSLLPQVRRLQRLLRVDDWERPVPTLVLSGALDPMVNVQDMRSLYARMAEPKRLVLLERAGHLHWADGAAAAHEQYRLGYLSGKFPDPEIDAIALGTAMRPYAELYTEEQAGSVARALGLAQLEAWLKGNEQAASFLDRDLGRALAGLKVRTEIAAD